MIEQDRKELTVEEIAERIGAKVSAVREALKGLGTESHRDLADRRRFVYPPGTAEEVRRWLVNH